MGKGLWPQQPARQLAAGDAAAAGRHRCRRAVQLHRRPLRGERRCRQPPAPGRRHAARRAGRRRLFPSAHRGLGVHRWRPRRATTRTPRSPRRCASRAAPASRRPARSTRTSRSCWSAAAPFPSLVAQVAQAGRTAGANACAVLAPRVEALRPGSAGADAGADVGRPPARLTATGPDPGSAAQSGAAEPPPPLSSAPPPARVIRTPRCDSRARSRFRIVA